ncbi:MAG: MurR/RpiR family transcriptional regulator [Sporolactobacillus sp.]|nr:MurR/RpiR family transcriptional regulator [Sporolactobacillus sp.]
MRMDSSIVFQIRAKLNNLSKSEKKVGQFVLDHLVETVNHNTSELAQMIGVSPATIVRFCRSVGLAGFSDLQVKLYAESTNIDQSLYTDIAPNESVAHISDKLAFRFKQSIAQTEEILDSACVDRFADLIDAKRTVYVYGLGASRIAAEDLAQKFSRIGKHMIHLLDHHLLASILINAGPDVLFVAVSNSGETKEVINLVKIAQQQNLTTIGILQKGNSRLGKLVDLAIAHGGGEGVLLRSAATTSLVSQLFIIDILYCTYICRHYDAAVNKLKDSRIIIRTMFSK